MWVGLAPVTQCPQLISEDAEQIDFHKVQKYFSVCKYLVHDNSSL